LLYLPQKFNPNNAAANKAHAMSRLLPKSRLNGIATA